jgi:predicted exporter
MNPYLTGWLTFIGLAYTTALYAMNMLNPAQKESRVWLHCTVGKLTLVTTLVHLISFPFDGFNYVAIWSAVGLIFITIGTGVILSYLPDAGKIRFHARSIHPALMVGIAVGVIHHVLVQLGIL